MRQSENALNTVKAVVHKGEPCIYPNLKGTKGFSQDSYLDSSGGLVLLREFLHIERRKVRLGHFPPLSPPSANGVTWVYILGSAKGLTPIP